MDDPSRPKGPLDRGAEMFAAVFQMFPNPISISDENGVLLAANEALARQHGFTPEELVGKRTVDLGIWKRPEDRARIAALLERDGEVNGEEVLMRAADGSVLHVLFYSRGIDVGGRKVMLSVSHDITALRRAEEAKREAEVVFSAVFNDFPFPISLLDEKNTVLNVNPALLEMHGLQREEVVGRNISEIPSWVDSRHRAAMLQKAWAEGHAGPEELELRDAGGGIRKMMLSSRRIESGGRVLMLSVAYDVTDLRHAQEEKLKLEQQVMHAQKLESLGLLAGGIAHDFNNLLTGILANADLALSERANPSAAGAYLHAIEAAGQRAADLCRQLLAYSGKGQCVVQHLELNGLVKEMGQLLSVSINKKALLQYHLADDLPLVRADATQLRQVVMNLITNASDAIGDGSGTITVGTRAMDCDAQGLKAMGPETAGLAPGRYVLLEVADTGQGMSAETQARIFEPFFTTKCTGRGLGLSAVLGIVRSHKGALTVRSVLGKGTTFRILLPEGAAAATVQVSPQAAAEDWRGHGLVLMVDDDPAILAVGRRILEKAGFDVLTAVDGREALEVFGRRLGEIRLVVLDLTMPNLDGEAAFGELRRISPEVKVVMTSGYDEQEVVNKFLGRGLAGFVHKPFKSTEFLPKVREALGE